MQVVQSPCEVVCDGDLEVEVQSDDRLQQKIVETCGEIHEQADAKWIVISGPFLKGHNDKPFGQPTPVLPIGGPGIGRL
jgi:hypothetical protein